MSDQDLVRDFYVHALGFANSSAMGRLVQGCGGSSSGLPARRPQSLQSRGSRACPPGSLSGVVLKTDDLDAEVGRLREQDVAFEGEIREAPWGRSVVVLDPDGNRIVLHFRRAARSSARPGCDGSRRGRSRTVDDAAIIAATFAPPRGHVG